MKTSTQIKANFKTTIKTGIFLVLLAGSTFFISCKQVSKTENVENNTAEQTDALTEEQTDTTAVNQGKNDTDNLFLAEAATINMEEIELGKLAQNKAASKDVKDFGKMMVDGHTKSLNELKDLATKKGVTLPQEVSEKGKNNLDELTKTDSKSFDKMYTSKMVDGHKESIMKFETARDNTADADIKSWTIKTLPDLQMHLDHAVMVQKKIK